MPQAEIEVAGAKAKSEVAAAIAADLAKRSHALKRKARVTLA